MIVHHQRQPTAVFEMVEVGGKGLLSEEIILRQRIAYQIRRLGIDQGQRDKIIAQVVW